MSDAPSGSGDDQYACNCGEVFDTLDQLKAHAKERHPEVYEEKFAS